MNADLDDALCRKYPEIFAQRHGDVHETAMCWGFDCEDGWYTLIERLCHSLQHNTDQNNSPQIVARQVKEKFGGLRFYYTANNKEGVEHNDYQYGEIEGLVDFAETMSQYICEFCGKPGKVQGKNWLKCACPDHEEK